MASVRPQTHKVCRNGIYPGPEGVKKCEVPDGKVSWAEAFPQYRPPEFFAVQPVPIPEDPDYRKEAKPVSWNTLDGHVNRKSHQGDYQVIDKLPRNPVGRTGICGRGRLARWGPNHAADPVITRWKVDANRKVIKDRHTSKPILQFITIKRGDSGQWAIPGGFVDSGEEANNALKREFMEEAMNTEEMSAEEKAKAEQGINKLFSNGKEVYRGYVDDPRNTDNCWMETTVVNFHDETGEMVGKINLKAGDDAIGVQWVDMNSSLNLYASHKDFVHRVAQLHNAHW